MSSIAAASAGARSRDQRARRDHQPVPFVAPLIVLLALSSLLPIGYSVVLSLFDWHWGSSIAFVGLDNYVAVLRSPDYWASLSRTLLFTVLAVIVEIVIGFIVALAVNSISRGVGWIRTILLLPLMVSGMVVALIWKVMLDPTLGIIPYLTSKIGLKGLNLLGSESTSLPTLVGMDTWWQTGFVFIILSAGLAALPQELFEAASVDGAGAWQKFRFLTVPLMLPLTATVAGIRTVDCLKVFALAYGATNGGPNRSTDFMQLFAYRTAFREFGMSKAMTMMVTYSLMIVLVVAILSLVGRLRHAR